MIYLSKFKKRLVLKVNSMKIVHNGVLLLAHKTGLYIMYHCDIKC